LDSLDARIFSELSGSGPYHSGVRQSYSSIARKLKVDEETVRRRIQRAERRGLLGGRELILNPCLIGREPVAMEVKVAGSDRAKKLGVVQQIKLVDGVLFIIDLQGESLNVFLYCENEQAILRRTALISSMAGDKHPLILRNVGFPRCGLSLTRTDLLILKSLRRDLRKDTANIATEIGVSARTIERRISLLTANNAFFQLLRPDFKRAEGTICRVTISYGDGKKKADVDEIIGSRLRIVYSMTTERAASQFTFVCNNVVEAEAIEEWIRGLDGVSEARMGIIREFILVAGWLDDEIERMLSEGKSANTFRPLLSPSLPAKSP
jgi:DNA-binding Lrp family transcriptional regulator